MFLTIVSFILILGLLVFVHELGHFVLAKRAGIKVEEFGFGFPPRIFGIKKGETIYSLNLFPLGGFVKIYGENGPEIEKGKPDPDKKRAFYNYPIAVRAKILIAGVTMNFLLAVLLLGFGFWIGLPSVIDDDQIDNLNEVKVQVLQVSFDSPANLAGIKIGDAIKELKQNKILSVNSVEQVQQFMDDYKGQEITVVIQRGDEVIEKKVTPRIDYPEEQGPLGIALARTAIVSYPWYRAVVMGITSAFSLIWVITIALGSLFWQMITVGKLSMEIAGPVGIFDLAGQATHLGFIYVLQLTAILSINLAILNLLPIPALDGGRLLFLGIEKIKGSPINLKTERIAQTIGFALLIVLMIAVTWRDVLRIF
ncbi:MAG: RIP metalloprotease RseP [bacterium]